MMRVDQTLCTLCGQCVDACPFAGVELGQESIEFTDSCRLCSISIKVCPTDAIWLEKSATDPSLDVTQYQDVLVFAEQRGGQIQPVTYELIGKALELAKQLGHQVRVCLVGSHIRPLAEELLEYGIDK